MATKASKPVFTSLDNFKADDLGLKTKIGIKLVCAHSHVVNLIYHLRVF